MLNQPMIRAAIKVTSFKPYTIEHYLKELFIVRFQQVNLPLTIVFAILHCFLHILKHLSFFTKNKH